MDAGNTTKQPTERGKLPLGETLSLVSICLDSDTSSQLKQFVDSTSLVQLRGELKNYLAGEEDAGLMDQLRDLQPDILLIDFDFDREQAIRTAERLHEASGIRRFLPPRRTPSPS